MSANQTGRSFSASSMATSAVQQPGQIGGLQASSGLNYEQMPNCNRRIDCPQADYQTHPSTAIELS